MHNAGRVTMPPSDTSSPSLMRLLISANSFHPNVGGYERVALTIALQLASRGHSVKIITFSAGAAASSFPFEIHRNPSLRTIWELFGWCDVYLQNNVSFKLLWPNLLRWRPLVFVHHGFYRPPTATALSWKYRLKHFATLFASNIAVSRAVADSVPGRCVVALNPYRDDVFFRIPGIAKDRDLFFVGRMVSDKGVDILVDAVHELHQRGLRPTLTLAGGGPEQPKLQDQVKALGLLDSVRFAGQVTDAELNELLNAHRIMVVPTRYGEGFGVVALEGIACGCVVVGSDCGGLPEAIGPCGTTFANSDPKALADVLFDLMTQPQRLDRFLDHAKAHLEAHRPPAVAEKYLDVLLPLARPAES